MNKTVKKYIAGLKKAYHDQNGKEDWDLFEKVIQGAKLEDLEKLKEAYPSVPDALTSLLEYVDGTYWRVYQGEKIIFYFLGSDIEEYPYYLLSSKQMVQNQPQLRRHFADYIRREYEGVDVDDKITDQADQMNWLHFSDCMNNGGSSTLYIDFSPSPKGTVGQIVRFIHDPDELAVIADSFEAYLERLMDEGYGFILGDLL